MNNEHGYVTVHRSHGISTIEFFHPQSNSLPGKILHELAEAIHNEGINADIKVIILRSAGEKTFCSGASFEELAAIQTEAAGEQFFSGFAHVINAMRKAPQLIIARIQGKCVGGGVGLAATADYAIATTGADVKLSELAVGIGPFVVGPAVERKIGLSAFSQLAIDAANWRPAEWAKQKGLYAELHAEISGMDESIHRLANFLSQSSITAIKELKHVFWQGTEHWDDLLHKRASVSGKLVLSDYTKKFIEQFKNKQK
ncbi:MAG: enoyl-CoA hydratase/isomerase family protein [Sphingobacteriales bacterium]|uniref:enoyl-CoA hydratase/isomerase family protein n=1 Tax=Hydrotalea flava TaxID=714549 RepID=UPI0008366319|nr:enoyl-CoA hydratase/isomerase family protein [Hydrotalea flava]RTL49835.1 MAG: enoyl-CoA hydratase/isomerase family protein [Sphingobacteriales bacterium]